MSLSFAVQRPPRARPSAFSADEDLAEDLVKDERIHSFDGAKRNKTAPKLVIASQPNKDWKAEAARLRSMARKRQTYLPDVAKSSSGASTPQYDPDADRIVSDTTGGLKSRQVAKDALKTGTLTPTTELAAQISHTAISQPPPNGSNMQPLLSEDDLALQALLKEPGESADQGAVETIDVAQDTFSVNAGSTLTEDDLFKQDLASRPDSSTLEDYARVPVDQFGAALLRGMNAQANRASIGSSSSQRPSKTEAYIPQARPSLLGIGARPLELPTDGKASKKEISAAEKAIKRREEMHFVPLVKRQVRPAGSDQDRFIMPTSASSTPPRPSRNRSSSPEDFSAKKRRQRSYSPHRHYSSNYADGDREIYSSKPSYSQASRWSRNGSSYR